MNTWVIADTHFLHDRSTSPLITVCKRPEDFTSRIVQNWTNTIHPDDLVYHLGDVFVRKSAKSRDDCGKLLRGLPGYKILIRGNHDKEPTAWYLQNGFMAVMEYAVVIALHTSGVTRRVNHYSRVLLSHCPMLIPDGVDFNLHGHFHNNYSMRWEQGLKDRLNMKHRLLAIEETDYKPVVLGESVYYDSLIHTYNRWKGILGIEDEAGDHR